MFELTCPTCGKRVQGDDSLLGKHIACPGCNAALTSPYATSTAITDTPLLHSSSDGAFSEDWPPAMPSLKKAAPHIVRRLLPYLIVVGILVTAALLLVPSVQVRSGYSARAHSTHKLKEISLAVQSFHDAHKRMPFNGTVAAVGGDEKSGSWAFQILPFIEQAALFKQPDTETSISTYMCPGRRRPEISTTGAWTDYCINPWLNDHKNGAVDAPDGKRTLLGITDGSSNTIFCGHGNIDLNLYESTVAIPQSTDIFRGGNPALARRTTINQPDKARDGGLNWGGPFSQGALMAWCDGTVRMIPYTTTGGVIRNGVSDHPDRRAFGDGQTPADFNHGMGKFLTPTGGEPVTLPD